MIEVKIKESDLRELQRDLKKIKPKNLLKGELNPLGRQIVQEAKQYPPPVGYPRTGRLGRSWHYTTPRDTLEIKNYAEYAGYVQGEQQTSFHKAHGWKNIYNITKDKVSKFIDKIEKKIDNIWR